MLVNTFFSRRAEFEKKREKTPEGLRINKKSNNTYT